LARKLEAYAGRPDAVVLGLARGGVVVAAPVALALDLPMDVLVIRKLGLPWEPEIAFGAVSSLGADDHIDVRDESVVAQLAPDVVERVVARERAEATRRELAYRADRAPLDLTGQIALVIDDGLATGATATAAVGAARGLGAARVVLAVPVGAPDTIAVLRRYADEVVCLQTPANFVAVSRWYSSFAEVSDAEVTAELAEVR
jgi:predicted phosphoribosyltransferase